MFEFANLELSTVHVVFMCVLCVYCVCTVLVINDYTQALMKRTKISYIKMIARTWDLVRVPYNPQLSIAHLINFFHLFFFAEGKKVK